MLVMAFAVLVVLASSVRPRASTSLIQWSVVNDDSTMYSAHVLDYKKERDIFDARTSATSAPAASLITLTTQLSADRLPSLRTQCLAWRGVCSAAIYVATEDDSEIRHEVRQVAQDVEHAGGRLVVSLLYSLELDGNNAKLSEYDAQYPVNALRNLATEEAVGQFVFALDVDFVPSDGLLEQLQEYCKQPALTPEGKPVALIIPAFETAQNADSEHVPRTYEDLIAQKAEAFHIDRYWPGHGPTNFTRWHELVTDPTTSANTADWTYTVNYEPDFEPYVVVNRLLAPRFSEYFRGYGYNKAEFLQRLDALGFTFQVLARRAFVVHGSHEKSEARSNFRSEKQNVNKLRSMIMSNLAHGLADANADLSSGGKHKQKASIEHRSFMSVCRTFLWSLRLVFSFSFCA